MQRAAKLVCAYAAPEYIVDQFAAIVSIGTNFLQLMQDRVGNVIAAKVAENVARRRLAELPHRLRRLDVRGRDLLHPVEQRVEHSETKHLRRRACREMVDQPVCWWSTLDGAINRRPYRDRFRSDGDPVVRLR